MSAPQSLDGDLDALVRRVDPDRWLSSRFITDPALRADVVALCAFDHELARAPAATSNALMGEIRLTWWREVLNEAFGDGVIRHHPTALALAGVVSRHGLDREPLETMIDARYRELDPTPFSETDALDWGRDTAGLVAQLAAGILDPATDAALAVSAGSAWAIGRRLAKQPELRSVFGHAMTAAKGSVRGLSPKAFPAAAHAALAGKPDASDLKKRLALTLAVARGRI